MRAAQAHDECFPCATMSRAETDLRDRVTGQTAL